MKKIRELGKRCVNVWKHWGMSLLVPLSVFAIGMGSATAAGTQTIQLYQAPPLLIANTSMSDLLAKYKNYDYNGDGKIEIVSLMPIAGVEEDVDSTPRDSALTLILVEPRLLNTIKDSTFSVADL